MIGIVVQQKARYRGHTCHVLLSWSLYFDLSSEVYFIFGPTFDRDRAARRANNCNCPAITEAPHLMSRNSPRKQRRRGHNGLVLLRRGQRVGVKNERSGGEK